MVYQTNKEESANIRKMMKEKYPDYKLGRNSHGKGTAYGWIHCDVIIPDRISSGLTKDQVWNLGKPVYRDVLIATNRQNLKDDIMTDYFEVNTLFSIWTRKDWNERTGKNIKDW